MNFKCLILILFSNHFSIFSFSQTQTKKSLESRSENQNFNILVLEIFPYRQQISLESNVKYFQRIKVKLD